MVSKLIDLCIQEKTSGGFSCWIQNELDTQRQCHYKYYYYLLHRPANGQDFECYMGLGMGREERRRRKNSPYRAPM